MEFFRGGKYNAFIYSRIGQNHEMVGQENQDCLAFERVNDDAWFLAIADGVSSAVFAKEGAQAAVDVICRMFIEIAESDSLPFNTDELKVKIVRNWRVLTASDWDKYATTLNFVMYVSHGLLLGQIGDGLIVANIDGVPKMMTDKKDFYSTETFALGNMVKKSMFTIERINVRKEVEVYMASDGIGKEIADESRIKLGKYLKDMILQDNVSIEEELDTWVIGLERKNGDDKSIGFVRWEE